MFMCYLQTLQTILMRARQLQLPGRSLALEQQPAKPRITNR